MLTMKSEPSLQRFNPSPPTSTKAGHREINCLMLEPNGPDAKTTITALLEILDGPRARTVQRARPPRR